MGKYLDLSGVTTLWSKTKEHVKTNVTDKKGVANGFASLGSDGKLPTAQLPALKTVNGSSIIGSGNIAIDLSLYKVVEALPTTGIDANKIYLVLTQASGGQAGNLYTEYTYVNNKWEELGKYKADVDLTPYVKFTDIASTTKAGAMSANDRSVIDRLKSNYLINSLTLDRTGSQISIPLIKGDNTSGKVQLPPASPTLAGLMTADDRTKLTKIYDTSVLHNIVVDPKDDSVELVYEHSKLGQEQDSVTGTRISIPLVQVSTVENGGETVDASTAGLMSPVDKAAWDKAKKLSAINLTDGGFVADASKVTAKLKSIEDNSVRDISFPSASSTKAGAMSSADYNKLSAIATGATSDSAISSEELNAILV